MKLTTLACSALLALAPALHAQTAPMEHHESKPSIPSHSLVIKANGQTTTLTLADLAAMPQQTVRVHNGHNQQDESYTGPALSTLLAKYGISTEGTAAQKLYRTYVRAEGTDKYVVLYSASELEPTLHTWEAIIAIKMNDQPLGEEGDFKMIATGERKPARWVRNLASLTIVTIE